MSAASAPSVPSVPSVPSSAEPWSDTVVHLRPRVPLASTQGTLALDLEPRREAPSLGPDRYPDPAAARPGTSASVVPIDRRMRREAESWAHRFAQAVVEIIGGDRPASQLVRWCQTEVYVDLRRRAQLVALAGGHQPGVRRVQPVRPRVHSVHACFVSPAIVETSVHVRYGARSRAIAVRFERRAGHWVCTALDFA